MVNIEKLKQKKIGEILDFFVNKIPPLKWDLQALGKKTEIKEKEIWNLLKKYEKEANQELKQIFQIFKEKLKKELNKDIDTI